MCVCVCVCVCAKTVPDSTKLQKGPRSKFPRGAYPHTPYFATCFAHRYVLVPPIIHTISNCPPLGQKLKELTLIVDLALLISLTSPLGFTNCVVLNAILMQSHSAANKCKALEQYMVHIQILSFTHCNRGCTRKQKSSIQWGILSMH